MKKNRVVIVGANRGIGLELARQYSQRGAAVVATCRQASEALRRLGCESIEGVDVAKDDFIEVVRKHLGNQPIDILIHNAGILRSDRFPDLSLASLREQFEVNTLGPLKTLLGLCELLPHGSKFGILSSRVGSIGDNSSSNNYGYRVSKTAVNMLGKCLALDLREQGVAVALLHPGYVRTDMTGGGGMIDVQESATGLIQRMDELSLATTGIFVHSNGEQLPW